MDKSLFLLGLIAFIPLFQPASAQIINVTANTPCFLNETAGAWVWRDCGLGDDYLKTMLLPWEWITGGNFSAIIAALFMLFSYIKYHKAMYPILVAVFMLPISYFVFPDTFIVWGTIFAMVAVAMTLGFIMLKQTKEY